MAHPSRLFPSGRLVCCGGSLIPSEEAAQAVDYIYPAKNRFRSKITQFLSGERLSIRDYCQLANLAFAIVIHDDAVRQRLVAVTNDEGSDERRKASVISLMSGGSFRHIVANAACGVDNPAHTEQLVDFIAVLADGDNMIADAVARGLFARSKDEEPFDYDGDYLAG